MSVITISCQPQKTTEARLEAVNRPEVLLHWPLGKVDVTTKMSFYSVQSRFNFPEKQQMSCFPYDCNKKYTTFIQIVDGFNWWSRSTLNQAMVVAIRQQAITWIYVDLDHWCMIELQGTILNKHLQECMTNKCIFTDNHLRYKILKHWILNTWHHNTKY